jgi:hypothetical protein
MAEEIKGNSESRIDAAVEAIKDAVEFGAAYGLDDCFRAKVNNLYNQIVSSDPEYDAKEKAEKTIKNKSELVVRAAFRVWREKLEIAQTFYKQCLQNNQAKNTNKETGQKTPNNTSLTYGEATDFSSPFDRRLDKLLSGSEIAIIPYDTRFKDAGTSGFIMSNEVLKDSQIEKQQEVAMAVSAKRSSMAKDPFYQGVASVINSYALTKLFGSEGGQYLVDKKGQRKWYEVDSTNEGRLAYSKNPTTTSIINWGEGDPYGRTPYHFADFVFCKYWNIIPNNRMITLRRYPAPIVDNLKFPGMDGFTGPGTASAKSDEGNSKNPANNKDINPGDSGLGQNVSDKSGSQTTDADKGSGKKVDFPPMATAITYFGEETENQLSDILKFTTGMNWGEVTADVFEVGTASNPEMESGPSGLFGGLTRMAKMLNIATGNFDSNAILNEGNLPPDPYKEGPYENRIIGPVNAITSVRRRDRGIKYENNIVLKFEYVARPIGGINTKAVLLDIISNFLIIGSASAMFWGGQHRFMGQPQKYPFMGGDKGIQQWYRGDPLGWGETAVQSFGQKVTGAGGLMDLVKNFFGTLLGGNGNGENDLMGTTKNILSGNNPVANVVKHTAVSKSQGSIPYLTGLKALLIGEPVGEWHLTIGNPLNPIAMIGNLICESMEVEFGNELGPDDFPLDVKITVNLAHGMARDRDAIQSMFNRGMGRIYDLPDSLTGSADYETGVDKNTGNAQTATGRSPSDWRLGTVIGGAATSGGKTGPSAVKENSMEGEVSVWNRSKFAAPSPNQPFFQNNVIQTRSEFKAANWISLKTTK